MQDLGPPTFNIPLGYFVGTLDDKLSDKYDDWHVKQREIICSMVELPKDCAHDNVDWYNKVVPKMKTELVPRLKVGLQAFVFQDESFWYDPWNSQHYLGKDVWGPYVMHYSKVMPLKKLYSEHPQVGVDVHILHDDVYMKIISDHPEEGFHEMFVKKRIQVFKNNKPTNHRYLMVDALTMLGLMQGEVTHYNRCYAFFVSPSCGPPPNDPPCAYCTYLPHGLRVTHLCWGFQTLHSRKAWKYEDLRQRDAMMQTWLKRQEAFVKRNPKDGWVDVMTVRPSGGDSHNVSDGSDLIISRGEIIRLFVYIPIARSECIPYVFPGVYGKNLLKKYASKWQEKIGGKILKISGAKIMFPAQMNYDLGVFAFPVALRCDILNLPIPDIVLRFSLRAIVVHEESKEILGYTVNYGKEVVTRYYPLDFQKDVIFINYKKRTMDLVSPPIVLYFPKKPEKYKYTQFVWLRVKKVEITALRDSVIVDVDRENLSFNEK